MTHIQVANQSNTKILGQQQTTLTKDIFRMAMAEFYEEKTDAEIEAFVAAAEEELQLTEESDNIEFNNLFIEVYIISHKS